MPYFRLRTKSISSITTTLLIFLLISLILISFTGIRVPDKILSLNHLNPSPTPIKNNCTPETAVVRKDWNNLFHSQKLNYINAVKCLQSTPSIIPFGEVPASHSLYDDFIAIHVNNTPLTHKSAIFLPWHRHFNFLFEKALHNHCSYPPQLGIPYWNWPSTPLTDPSALFSPWLPPPQTSDDTISESKEAESPAENYHCILAGPFANTTVTFGPIDVESDINTTAQSTWSLANPHCLSRSPSYSILTTHLTLTNLLLALSSPTIDIFTQHVAGTASTFALHGYAHKAIGGQMADSFCASADPIFYLHHSMVDRLWSLWVDQDPGRRRWEYCCEDAEMMFRDPDVEAIGNGTVMNFGVLGGDIRLEKVVDTMRGDEGGYCYRYE